MIITQKKKICVFFWYAFFVKYKEIFIYEFRKNVFIFFFFLIKSFISNQDMF